MSTKRHETRNQRNKHGKEEAKKKENKKTRKKQSRCGEDYVLPTWLWVVFYFYF